jgi:hypothetical protein
MMSVPDSGKHDTDRKHKSGHSRRSPTCFAEAQLNDAAGNVIAKATSTMRVVSQAKVADGSRAAVGG